MGKSREIILNFAAFLIGLAILVALFFAYEWGAKNYQAIAPTPQKTEKASGEVYIKHHRLERLLKPNNKITQAKRWRDMRALF